MSDSLTEVSLVLRGKMSSGEDVSLKSIPMSAVRAQLDLLDAIFGDDVQELSAEEGSFKLLAKVTAVSLGFGILAHIEQGHKNKIPPKVLKASKNLEKQALAGDFEYSLSLKNKPNYYVVNKETVQKNKNQKDFLHIMTGIVDGEITDAGGASQPNIHLKVNRDLRLVIAATKKQLQLLEENLLYQHKRIKVQYSYNIQTGEKKDYKLLEIIPFKGIDYEALNHLHQQGTQIWKDVLDSEAWVQELRS